MCRDIETNLLTLHNGGRQSRLHQLLEQVFLARTANLEISRQSRGKFHDTVIQEGRANFDSMRHAHAIGLH